MQPMLFPAMPYLLNGHHISWPLRMRDNNHCNSDTDYPSDFGEVPKTSLYHLKWKRSPISTSWRILLHSLQTPIHYSRKSAQVPSRRSAWKSTFHTKFYPKPARLLHSTLHEICIQLYGWLHIFVFYSHFHQGASNLKIINLSHLEPSGW